MCWMKNWQENSQERSGLKKRKLHSQNQTSKLNDQVTEQPEELCNKDRIINKIQVEIEI